MALHVGIGFGLNEIYIMTAQWIYVIPLAMAFLFSNNRWMGLKRGLVAALTLYLYIYNSYFIIDYMLC